MIGDSENTASVRVHEKLGFQHAGVGFVILQSDHYAVEAWRDLFVGKGNGFEQVFTIFLRSDMAEVGPDIAAPALGAMTADTLRFRFVEKDLSAQR